ncbi:3-carboxy-cis,cis-muconate cycloisomerase [Pseudovibrio sp. Tun.PSC04-5.I4]|uniref:3-carboxy-cis,cis-muconate cycloisomerase n=1 Tax=Pseudovibrio sp. Tun.PSC04-5.I4 TaxID=1798213 RepID=UPI00088AFE81|nr:3-carboxy-cis,cis-muconate cycloisomerase [Pseudovibrio sp. Tun.PSC04-5.I4]SDR48376.1 3-carboxy-cis,cis-muconate cycloisomerase [Pseudovibrio sp. Tun.PSC04-5.I4]
MSVSLFLDPIWGGLFGDEEVQNAFSPETTLAHYLAYEVALTNALCESAIISNEARDGIVAGCKCFQPDVAGLRAGTAIDGLPIPAFIKQLKAHIGAPHASDCHKTSTSQDVMDTALALSLKHVSAIFSKRLTAVIAALKALNDANAAHALMGRTRMQAALPITATDRILTWIEPLKRHQIRLERAATQVAILQMGGPVGTNSAQAAHGDVIVSQMAQELGLGVPDRSWHTQRDGLAEFAGVLSMISGNLGKIGTDIALMAQQGIDEVKLRGGGSSSAMPHKQNPIKAELLVTLARYNAAQVSVMHGALVHEQERSGASWAVEWMVLPGMCMTTGCGLATALELFQQIEWIGTSQSD